MSERSRHQEDRSMSSQASSPQMKTGVMPHGFPMRPDSSMVTPHPLAYGIIHQPQMGQMQRVNPNARNDLGPPIFMPSLNLGVPRAPTTMTTQVSKQSKNSLNQPMMPASYMSEVMAYPPQPIMFHPSQVRPGQQTYIPPISSANMKTASTKAPSTKSQNVLRPTPKQPTSLPLPTNSAPSRPRGESPVDQITFVHSPPSGSYLVPHQMGSQAKANTLSKMLMSPQQSSVVSSSAHQMGGAYVSHNTTLRTAVPTLTSIAAANSAGKGSFPSAPDGYHGQQSVTTSGQSTSIASFTDTKTERPPQPSASSSPIPSPQSCATGSKDKSNIIIKGSSLTGRHIAAITNTTMQHSGGGTAAPTYTSNNQGLIPQTVHSLKAEHGPPDTGWHKSPNENSTSNQKLIGNQQSKLVSPGGGVSVPIVSAPVLSTQTHSPGGSSLSGSPVRHGPHPQGLSTSPRPHILRKRPIDSNQVLQGELQHVPMSPTSDVVSQNHVSSRLDGTELTVSPRKKPRKQNMVTNDDMYASNVPDSLSSSSASSLDAPLSVEGSEESSRSTNTSVSTRSSKKSEPSKESNSTPEDVEIRYLSQLRKSPYLIGSHHRAYHKAPHNHFKQHSDIKHRDEVRMSAVQLASDDNSQHRAGGWRVHHAITQINEMSKIEQDVLEMTNSMLSLTDEMKRSHQCAVDSQYVDSLNELLECTAVRSTRILSHITDTKDKSKQILENSGHVSELLSKCRPPSPLPSPLLTNHHSKPRT